MKYYFLTILCFLAMHVFSQSDYSWWNSIHSWDGHTSWLKYLKYSAKYFGPNALPVPEAEMGSIYPNAYLKIAADAHFSKGDKTQNAFLKAFYPFSSNKVACEIYLVPIEFFKTDTITRDIRAARDRDGEGTAGGDIYFSTLIQILKDKKGPDILLRWTLRTASGTNVSAARYTDAPGYFFDISFGKNIAKRNSKLSVFRPFFDLGFYSWQTNDENHRQNDAPYYSAGVYLEKGKCSFLSSIAGYHGYLKIHDAPLVFRTELCYRRKKMDYSLSYQYGINDFIYQSLRFSMKYLFLKK